MMRFIVFASLLLVAYHSFAQSIALANTQFKTSKGPISLTLEVASTPEQRAVGLMNRQNIGQFQGMLFLFPKVKNYEFWMSNTYIPLDMIFVGPDDSIVHIIEKVPPQSRRPRSANQLVKAVIELPGGTARDSNIRVGDHVTYAISQPVEVR